jgi:hypothetical protein
LVLMSPEEGPVLARIERQLGRRLPRRHVEDFDYGAAPAPAARPRPGHRAPAHAHRPGRRPARGRW